MTEPRELEAVDGEAADGEQLNAPAPDTGAWYPVTAPVEEPAVAVPVEPVADESTVAVPQVPVAGEPAVTVPEEPVAGEPAVTVPEEPVAEESTVTVTEEPVAGEPAVAVPEVPVAEESTVTVPQVPVVEEPTVTVPEEHPRYEGASRRADEADEIETVGQAEPSDASTEPTTAFATEPAAEPTTAFATEPAAEPTTAFASPESLETSATQRLQIEDDSAAVPGAPADAIFRPASPTSGPSPEPTRIEQPSEEEQKLAAERAARREARAAALAAPAPAPLMAAAPVIVHKRTNDKFWGALGLFLLRVVLAGIFAIRGLNILTDIAAAQKQFATTVLPEPGIFAIVTGVAAELIALSLLLGLLTRVAGLGIALIAGGALAFVFWGPSFSPFVQGQPGFLGEYELLLAAVGVLLLLVGGGGWSLDRSFRAGRERDKRERAASAA